MTRSLLATLACVALLGGGCSGSDDDGAPPPEPSKPSEALRELFNLESEPPRRSRHQPSERSLVDTPPLRKAGRVTLALGHCDIEPIEAAGRKWAAVERIGWGGELPVGFSQRGRFVVVGADQARFDADRGARVEFKRLTGPLLRVCR